jgi:hypothetical protein
MNSINIMDSMTMMIVLFMMALLPLPFFVFLRGPSWIRPFATGIKNPAGLRETRASNDAASGMPSNSMD